MQNRAFLYFDVFSTSDRESELWDTLWRNHIENYGDTIKKEGGAFIDELFITIIKTLMEKKSDLWRYGRLNPNLDRSKEASIVFFPRCLGLLYSSWVRRWPSFPRLKISVNRVEEARPHSKMTCAACPKPPSINRPQFRLQRRARGREKEAYDQLRPYDDDDPSVRSFAHMHDGRKWWALSISSPKGLALSQIIENLPPAASTPVSVFYF